MYLDASDSEIFIQILIYSSFFNVYRNNVLFLCSRSKLKIHLRIENESQQDPLWSTSQNIGNKSKSKQIGPNET